MMAGGTTHDHDHDHGHGHDRGHGHGHQHQHSGGGGGGWRWVVAAAALVVYGLSGIRVVGPAERGIVQRFGRVVDTQVRSGVHLGLPVGMEALTCLEVRKTRRVSVGMGLPDRVLGSLPDPALSQFLTGDRNIVDVRLSVQYTVADPARFLFACDDVDGAVRRACESALCDVVTCLSVDDVLTRRRAEIQLRVREEAQVILDAHGVGVQILAVSQERAAPPERVADAFRAVTSARADSERQIAEAHGHRDDLLPRARGEARAVLSRARADAYRIVTRAEGQAERFSKILGEAAQAPALTRRRLHAEMLEEVMGVTRLVLTSPEHETDVKLLEGAR